MNDRAAPPALAVALASIAMVRADAAPIPRRLSGTRARIPILLD